MKTAIIYNTFYYVAKFRLPLIKAMLEDGHSVLVLAPRDNFMADIENAGAEVVELPDMSSAGSIFLKLLPTFWLLFMHLRRRKIDVVFTYTIFPNLITPWIAKILNIRCYPNIAGLGSFIIREPNLGTKILTAVYALSAKISSGVFFQNLDDQHDLGMHDNPRAVLLPGSGVDTYRFSPRSNQLVDYDRGPINILFVGRLLKQKGVIDFIELSERVPHAEALPESIKSRLRFTVVGERIDAEREVNEKLDDAIARKLITYDGTIPPSGIESVYRGARFFVLPTTYGEGVPRTILEASSMGVPCLAYAWRGVRDAIDHDRGGWLIEPGNVCGLAAKLAEALELKSSEYRRMSEYAREAMKRRFSEEIVIARYRAAIHSP